MAFGVSANRSLASRGPSPGFRFALYAIASITLMTLDQRGQWIGEARYYLQIAAWPVQLAVSSPSAAWRWMEDSVETRDALRAENETLRARQRQLEMRTQRFEALERENAELRGLRDALPPVADRWLVAEVVNAQLDTFRQSVLLNRGARHGVFESQAVMDDLGLIGQTTHVGPWSTEVILITDPEHAVPVQIERTGVRTIAVGTGAGLALPYLPANADVKQDDLLITSGLGGVFPQGYPVARVTGVQREAVQPLAQVRATPLARLDRVREVMLVWFKPEHPAAPGPTSGGDLKTGDPKAQPQPAPPKPKPAPSPTADAAAADASKPGATTPAAKPATGTAAPKPNGPIGGPHAPVAPAPKPQSTPPAPTPATASPDTAKAGAERGSSPMATVSDRTSQSARSATAAQASAEASSPTANKSSVPEPARGASRAAAVSPASSGADRANLPSRAQR